GGPVQRNSATGAIDSLGPLANSIVGNGAQGISIAPSVTGVTILGVTIQGNWISRDGQNGIAVTGASGAQISDNLIGTDSSGGTTFDSNTVTYGNVLNGILLSASAGGSVGAAVSRNVISGNGLSGISVQGSPGGIDTALVRIQGNLIGTDQAGKDVT